jgi:glycosyltransferase involved in cell wall biosynthesis
MIKDYNNTVNVLFDNQIFKAQKFGGINRYYNELSKSNNIKNISFRTIENNFTIHSDKSMLKKLANKLKRKLKFQNIYNEKDSVSDDLIKRLQFDDYDVFHPTYYDPYFLPYVKKPIVVTVYDMIHEIYPEYFCVTDKTSANKRKLCEKANIIIAISETTKNDLINFFDIDPYKIVVTLLGSNFHSINDSAPKLEVNRFILFTGGRSIYKNFYFMVQNLVEIFKQDQELKLVCTGNNFTFEEVYFFKQLGIEKNLVHINVMEDEHMSWLYKNAICFIFPSLYEGFGFPILEAFSSGCPVVSSYGGSLKEIGGIAASFFDPKDCIDFKAKLKEVLYNKNIRDNMIRNGFIEYKKYSWDKCRNETINIYKSII